MSAMTFAAQSQSILVSLVDRLTTASLVRPRMVLVCCKDVIGYVRRIAGEANLRVIADGHYSLLVENVST